mmetsp:Transcript_62852/g.185623  ORF Transcript_62852/g.185623 Transcript_62852/m.185623 type:complete len:93 (+) Transcript_62852:219-497(+)
MVLTPSGRITGEDSSVDDDDDDYDSGDSDFDDDSTAAETVIHDRRVGIYWKEDASSLHRQNPRDAPDGRIEKVRRRDRGRSVQVGTRSTFPQ